METQQKVINIGIISAILLLVAGYVNVTVLDDDGIELEPTHYCQSRELRMYCARTTAMYCRPSNTTNLGSKKCSEGWELIPEPIPKVIKVREGGSGAGEVCDSKVCYLQ